MGEEVSRTQFSRAQRREYRRKVQLCLDVFETMLAQSSFEFDRPLTGMEIECNLVDDDYQPALRNQEVLASIADPAYQTELGAYNIEFNVPPRPLPGQSALELEDEVRASLNAAEAKAAEDDAHIVMIGILPTLMPEHLKTGWMSESTRYQALNDSIFTARGEDIDIDITGPERLSLQSADIAPESACTSMQLHLQVSPAEFAENWNAAQVVAGPQLALGANSPYFFGHELWAETRIELFSQATDTRADELKTQGVRPRVWFGERWITSIFDLFEENVRYFPSLLPEISDEDPVATLAEGRTPQLAELRLHNGTIYRWNRPVYDVVNGKPHLRVENRVLPAGPTVIDMLANSAFYYGTLRALTDEDRPLWTKMSFAAAQHNFFAAARHGMEARQYWPGLGEVTADELVLRELLPLAHEGLRRWGVAAEVRDRYLGVIEGRAKSGRNGAAWQAATVRALQERGMARPAALAEMLRMYCEHMHSNAPVHTWDTPTR
ncbi:glutamate--cysteine ligase [Mycolicibacterium diernhoferi]|uniref:Glutamate--cysteine ligase n=1 Tax=Mycolicibacterium diernhoferi TaxID=1801 RepID=A0A1Q4H5H0_9MYCO|nr:glutamate--cysteine ligase [Mycolicibacterium diernhoferi]OJZ62715.1 glutamate--cysteine ligase [Mycolicibacterium diernhoferi]OPE51211.1 glutamate--cysteine ligase [Mycolicibacterium diernhoferi]PEG52665.1 glutamate--cysteine ligase [Mycolicibacterium diernhoferi]QYL22482.1 glutamate--cysteine ligase [Mycolicibacterium diernhoferi]